MLGENLPLVGGLVQIKGVEDDRLCLLRYKGFTE